MTKAKILLMPGTEALGDRKHCKFGRRYRPMPQIHLPESNSRSALDAVKVAQEVASQRELGQRMQGIVLLGVFLRVAPFVEERGLSDAEVDAAVEKSLRKFFGKRGEKVVQENLQAVRRAQRRSSKFRVM